MRSDYDKLLTQSQDKDAKIESAQQNADELRHQLDQTKDELKKLHDAVQLHESELATYRKERNAAFDERDQLLNMVDRQNCTIDRLKSDIATLEQQLQAAIASKCEAITKCDEIESREHSVAYKEKFMEQERTMLNQQIDSLSTNLNKTMAELHTIRQENVNGRLQLDAELAKKTQELKLATSIIQQYTETNEELTTQAESLTTKLRDMTDESTKMMEAYNKELQSKTKLADLYKEEADDRQAQVNELTATYLDMKKVLSENTEQYGELETRLRDNELKHAELLAAKDAEIQSLHEEIANANELLKASHEENVENALERLTPTAAAASRRLKSNMTLTQIYTLYVKAAEDLQLKERECNLAQVSMKSILAELEEKSPEIKRQAIEYQNVLAINEELNAQLEQLINERVRMREQLAETQDRFGHFERENKKLKVGQADLGRQVMHLLKEIEQMRGGFASDQSQSISSDMSANEVISRKLVTFNDIAELQDNNQKLLLLVRDLSGKLEEFEELQSNVNQAAYEAKIAQYTKRVQDLEAASESQAQMIASCIRQKDRFKRLYYEIMKDVGKIPTDTSDAEMVVDDESGGGDANSKGGAKKSDASQAEAAAGSDASSKDDRKCLADYEDKIKEYVKQLRTLREEYDEYRKEKLANDKLTNQQIDAMRKELRELTTSNCKAMSSANYNGEQIKIQQKNTSVLKKQIQTLEERNRNYDHTIVKHEQTILYLRNEAMGAQQRCSAAEIKCEELQRQSRKLIDDVSRLTIERDALYRERQSQNLLQNNLELIKNTFERSENDGRIRMEQRFDEVQRECSALRRRLQEEQDNFRQLAADLKRQTESAVAKMQDELALGNGLRKQIADHRDELAAKAQQIDDLSNKLQESLTPCQSDNPIAKANKKVKELQQQRDEQQAELEQAKRDYAALTARMEQVTKMANDWEMDSKELHEHFEEYKAKMSASLAESQLNETNLKSRVEELQTEIRLQITGAQINTTDTTTELHKVQNELKTSLTKISENNRELRDLRAECQHLKQSLQSIEQKYSNEMQLHSSDIQAYTMCKDELNKAADQLLKLRVERDSAVEMQKAMRNEMESMSGHYGHERQELDGRLKDLDAQNSLLHDQLQVCILLRLKYEN